MIYLTLFLTFFKIGLFTIGGGYAMIPLIQSEIVDKGFMSFDELLDFIAVSESTPGPFAVNIATYVGAEMAGFWGAVLSTLGVVLPSFIIILTVASFFRKFKENKYVKGCMSGLKPAVVGLIGAAILSIAKTDFFPDGFALENINFAAQICTLIITSVMFLLAIKKIHPIIIVLISAAAGIGAGYLGIYGF